MKGGGDHAERYRNLASQCYELLQRIPPLKEKLHFYGGNYHEQAGSVEMLELLLRVYGDVAKLEHSILVQGSVPVMSSVRANPEYSEHILLRMSDLVGGAKLYLSDLEKEQNSRKAC